MVVYIGTLVVPQLLKLMRVWLPSYDFNSALHASMNKLHHWTMDAATESSVKVAVRFVSHGTDENTSASASAVLRCRTKTGVDAAECWMQGFRGVTINRTGPHRSTPDRPTAPNPTGPHRTQLYQRRTLQNRAAPSCRGFFFHPPPSHASWLNIFNMYRYSVLSIP